MTKATVKRSKRGAVRQDEYGRTEIQSWDEVPEFASEAAEQAWWDKHTVGKALLGHFRSAPPEGDADLPPARTPTLSEQISLRLESDTLQRLKRLANKKHMGYQTLLKTFLAERLYEEEKQG